MVTEIIIAILILGSVGCAFLSGYSFGQAKGLEVMRERLKELKESQPKCKIPKPIKPPQYLIIKPELN